MAATVGCDSCDTAAVQVLDAMPAPELTWGLLTRLIGVVYLITFSSLWRQVLAFAGSDGISPVALKLRAAARDIPGPRRLLFFPSLLWLSSSDRALRALPIAGAACALLVIVGGPLSFPALLGCYVLYLSLDVAVRLTFPWECVLFEAGFLALFLEPTLLLPELSATAAPESIVAWGYRLLLFRVLFGFGKFKFIGSTRQDRAFLRGFLINQPLPTPLAVLGARSPLWLLEAGLWALFVVEIILPFGVFVPGLPSVIAAAGFIGLMLVIQLSGNFGFFNLLVGFLSLSLLDSTTPVVPDASALLDPALLGELTVVHVLVGLHMVGGLLHLPMNQYFSQGWLHWTAPMRLLPAPLLWPLQFFRGLHALRWVQSYGVFPPKAMAAVRNVAVVEASWDDETWVELKPMYAPTCEDDRPTILAPHHARYAQALIYDSYGTTDYSLAYSVAGTGVPYYHARYSEARCLLQRVLEGKRYEGTVFRRGSFDGHDGPPRRVRMRTFMMLPRASGDFGRDGLYWHRTYVGPHIGEQVLEPDFWARWLPQPETWDWDSLVWKRRSRLSSIMRRARAAERTEKLCEGEGEGDGVSSEALDELFGELVPLVAPRGEQPFDHALADARERVEQRFDPAQLLRHERLLGRLSVVLSASLEPHFFSGREPVLELPTYLHVRMLVHDIICRGREAYERARVDPAFAVECAAGLTEADGMRLQGIFSYERLVAEAQKIRLLDTVLARASERHPQSEKAAYEASVDAMAKRIWGVAHLTPQLRGWFIGERFERGQPERYPRFELREDGSIEQTADR